MKRGPKPKGKVVIKWSPDFAYAIGLIVADGCLSKDGRHIVMTSKDKEQLIAFNNCLGLSSKIAKKFFGAGDSASYVQFSDVLFYAFLLKIGLSPAKSKTISEVKIPRKYFFDFLRGYFDGDGCSYSYYDPVFKRSYRFYISFSAGSEKYLNWLRNKLTKYCDVKGFINRTSNLLNFQLKYSKKEAVVIAKKMYYTDGLVCLRRKKLKINKSLGIIQACRRGEIGRHAAFRSL